MSQSDITLHHELEAELHRLRLLRDLRDEDFDEAREEVVLDEMEALWYRLSAEDQRVLDAEREARAAFPSSPPNLGSNEFVVQDLPEDLRARLYVLPRHAFTPR